MKKAIPGSSLSTTWRRKAPASTRGLEREIAQELAVRALVFLAADSERARRFAAASGLSADNLRTAAETPDFLVGVLDYFAGDESLLLAFTGNCDIDPADVQRARAALSSGSEE